MAQSGESRSCCSDEGVRAQAAQALKRVKP